MRVFKKKILSLLLVVAMLMTMIPTNILAITAENNNEEEVISGESIIKEDSSLDIENQDISKNEDDEISSENNNEEIQDENNEENNKEEDKENPELNDDKLENDKSEIEWPKKPSWVGKNPNLLGVPELQSGQNSSSFYAIPQLWVTNTHIEKAQEESKDLQVDNKKEISEENFNMKLAVFIDGKEYKNGNITVKEGENFSYRLDWGPINASTPEIKNGDYFTKKLFTVKGLGFDNIKKKLIIDDINVGEMSIVYDKNTGDMNYTVTFTKYINMFKKDSIFAYFQGSSSFKYLGDGVSEMEIWGNKGSLTVEKNEAVIKPNIPSGNGWEAPVPPTYSNSIRPLVKGVKWDNHGQEGNNDPQIEWRVVFLEKLQKKQQEFLKEHPIETKEGILGKIDKFIEDTKLLFNTSIDNIKLKSNSNEKRIISEKGYCIVEDTLDENQEFSQNHTDLKDKYGGAPFFIELPVMLVGTNHIANRGGGVVGGAGDHNGNGPGDIQTYFSGENFKEIKEGNNSKKKDVVKNTPMTYAILKKDEKNKRETLIINLGKLGEAGSGNLNWTGNEWPNKKLEEQINNCQNKIDQIVAGQNSPISNMKTKYTELENLLRKILSSSNNKISESDKEKINEFIKDYNKKVIEKGLKNDEKIDADDIPSLEKLKVLEGIIADENGGLLQNNIKYANYKKSLENLINDQNIFLENRLNYAAEWKILKSKYERTLEFYSQGTGIYGFILKVRSKKFIYRIFKQYKYI